MNVRPLVSVVVPSKDAGAYIERCLRAARSSTHPVELIVVDNHSTDGTWAVAQELADVAIQAGPERSVQRNLGIAQASGEYLLWLDADMELEPDAVAQAVAVAEAEGATGVFIDELCVGEGYWTACRRMERLCYRDEPRINSPRLVRRDYLLRTSGFADALTGTEDADLRARMRTDGSTLVRAPRALLLHDHGRLTYGGLVRRAYYYGRWLPTYRSAQPGAVSDQLGATVVALARRWRWFVEKPGVGVGVLAMRAGEALGYLAGSVAGSVGAGRSQAAATGVDPGR